MNDEDVELRGNRLYGLHFKDYPYKAPKLDTLNKMTESVVEELAKVTAKAASDPKDSNMKIPIVVLKESRNEGLIEIEIADDYSLSWFKGILPHLKPRGLKFGKLEEVERFRIVAQFPESIGKLSYEKVLGLIEKQNNVSTKNWTANLQTATKLWRQKQVLFVDRKSKDDIHRNDYELKCGIEKVVFDQPNLGRKSVMGNNRFS